MRNDTIYMIKGFKCKETEKIWNGSKSYRLPTNIQNTARRKLRMINSAVVLADLKVPPNNRLKYLQGDRKGQLSIRINSQWRVCFIWEGGNCSDVEIIDYHR